MPNDVLRAFSIALAASLLALFVHLSATSGGKLSKPAAVPMAERDQEKSGAAIDEPQPVAATLEDAVDHIVQPFLGPKHARGCVVVLGTRDRVLLRRAYGDRSVSPGREPMTPDTIFDLASLTKPIATASSILLLAERGRLDLDAPVSAWIPSFGVPDKAEITVRMLLTHTSGLPAASALSHYEKPTPDLLATIGGLPLRFAPGTGYLYSDVGYVVLGLLVRPVAGVGLSDFARTQVFEPLGMHETRFLPMDAGRIAPTEPEGGRMLRGIVHDPRARRMGGVAGHAGLFSTADDLSRFARALLGGGVAVPAGPASRLRVLQEDTVASMWSAAGHSSHPRTAAWDIVRVWDAKMGRTRMTFAHGGFTGTYLWLDPERGNFMVLLSSRLHPDGKGNVLELRAALRRFAVEQAAGSSEAGVQVGVDVLQQQAFRPLAGKRVALLTHDAAVDARGRRTVDVLHEASNVNVVALLVPEHGMNARGEGRVADGMDPRTGLPIVALYGPRRAPPAAWLDRVDVVVVDLQDVGVRFYTYGSTMLRTLRAASARGKAFVVLDRPNPLGGVVIDGPLPGGGADDWLHPYAVPIRHGLTLGELSLLAAREWGLATKPEVVTVRGWSRKMLFQDTGLGWTPPSPNLRTPEQALLYPGVALLEATNVSVGRGTETPFEVVGAPWMDERLAERLGKSGLAGVEISPATFQPTAGPYAGEACRGVRFRVVERRAVESMRLGYSLVLALRALYPDHFRPKGVLTLVGHRPTYDALMAARPVEEILELAAEQRADFEYRRKPVLLYEPFRVEPGRVRSRRSGQ
jgi:uncharacterized protein YbbC (DUF1343 family)